MSACKHSLNLKVKLWIITSRNPCLTIAQCVTLAQILNKFDLAEFWMNLIRYVFLSKNVDVDCKTNLACFEFPSYWEFFHVWLSFQLLIKNILKGFHCRLLVDHGIFFNAEPHAVWPLDPCIDLDIPIILKEVFSAQYRIVKFYIVCEVLQNKDIPIKLFVF